MFQISSVLKQQFSSCLTKIKIYLPHIPADNQIGRLHNITVAGFCDWKILWKAGIRNLGIAKRVVSDRNSQFTSNVRVRETRCTNKLYQFTLMWISLTSDQSVASVTD